MKHIEIVLATHGENIFWANGLESIVTEYSTKKQEPNISDRHRENRLRNISFLNHSFGHNPNQTIHDFLKSLRSMVRTARDINLELTKILSPNGQDGVDELGVLSGHNIVNIENDNNLNEANQFLYHITKRYDSLAETTIFLQGHPFDHVKNPFAEILKSIGKDFSCLPSPKIGKLGDSGHDLLARQFGEIITKKKVESSCWSAGACFMASKSAILANPLSWYENVLKEAKDFKDSKFALERLWAVVIKPNEDWS